MIARDKFLTIAGTMMVIVVSFVAYRSLDLREPRRTRELLRRFDRGDISAWDEYKMDPPRSARAVSALMEGMHQRNAVVRERAVVGICGLSRDEGVVSELRRLTQDDSIAVRQAATHCLRYDYGEGQPAKTSESPAPISGIQ